ncbi:unnamed protein product, partial [Iphiclides podalirius]
MSNKVLRSPRSGTSETFACNSKPNTNNDNDNEAVVNRGASRRIVKTLNGFATTKRVAVCWLRRERNVVGGGSTRCRVTVQVRRVCVVLQGVMRGKARETRGDLHIKNCYCRRGGGEASGPPGRGSAGGEASGVQVVTPCTDEVQLQAIHARTKCIPARAPPAT